MDVLTVRDMAPSNLSAMRTEDLLALSEQLGRSAECACGKRIVELGTGAWRSDTHPQGADRIACTASKNKRHHPVETPDADAEIPSRAGDLT